MKVARGGFTVMEVDYSSMGWVVVGDDKDECGDYNNVNLATTVYNTNYVKIQRRQWVSVSISK